MLNPFFESRTNRHFLSRVELGVSDHPWQISVGILWSYGEPMCTVGQNAMVIHALHQFRWYKEMMLSEGVE